VELQDENPVGSQAPDPLAECSQLVGLVGDTEATVDDDVGGFAGTAGVQSELGEQIEPQPAERAGELRDRPRGGEDTRSGEGSDGITSLPG
jgi:hypothetical protein